MALLHRIQLALVKVTTVTPTLTTLFTVPAGYRYVVKNITARNNDGTAGRTLVLFANGLIFYSIALGVGGTSTGFNQLETDIVFHPGDVIQAEISGGTLGITVTISGSQYSI